jgi:hypothetical protein
MAEHETRKMRLRWPQIETDKSMAQSGDLQNDNPSPAPRSESRKKRTGNKNENL